MRPWLDDVDVQLFHGSAVDVLRALPAGSVQTCVTSPPYWGLRSYLDDQHVDKGSELGLERTPSEYVASLVAVFAEVWRVLRADGTVWCNLGDSYASAWACDRRNVVGNGSLEHEKRADRPNRLTGGLKEKDLVGIPWRVAFALQEAGWYLRSDIIWHKPAPMPESVTDRPTKSHEYLFLLSKQPRYFYDADAIREAHSGIPSGNLAARPNPAAAMGQGDTRHAIPWEPGEQGRNARSVWTINTQPTADAHFAVFPEALVRRCILAGTSSIGQCKRCGRPVVPSEYGVQSGTNTPPEVRGVWNGFPADPADDQVLLEAMQFGSNGTAAREDEGLVPRPEGLHPHPSSESSDGEPRGLRDAASASDGGASGANVDEGRGRSSQERREGRQPFGEPGSDAETASRSQAEASDPANSVSALRRDDRGQWSCPACHCSEVVPQTVLDCFVGSGTTALVARKLGRRAIGVDLSADYLEIAARRLGQQSLFA